MPFIEGLGIYYTQMLDATIFVAAFLVASGFVVISLPHTFRKRDIVRLILTLIIGFISCIVVPSIGFGISNFFDPSFMLRTMFVTAALPLVVLTFCLIFLQGKPIHRFLKIIVLITTVLVADALSKNFGLFMGTLTGDKSVFVIIARMIPYIFFTAMCFLLYKIDIVHYGRLSKEMIIIVTSLSVSLFGVAAYEHYLTVNSLNINLLLAVLDVALLIILGLAYYATYKNIENRHKLTNLEVQKTLADAEIKSIRVDQVNREELEKLRHDIKNHFHYLNILLEKGDTDEAGKYVKDYLNTSDEVLNSFSCSNSVLNSIINLELTKAKAKDVKMDIKVVVPPKLPFEDADMVSLLTNMIDNALENYEDETNQAKIVVRIYKQNDFIRFFVSNPINNANVSPKSITTTRKLGRGHGYGTKIIKNIARTYDGYADFSVEENFFIADVLLNMEIKEEEKKDD